MAQAANQLHQIQKKQRGQLGGSINDGSGAGGGAGILSRMLPNMKNHNELFSMDPHRPQPTKAQLTMPPSLQHKQQMNSLGTNSDLDRPRVSLGGPLPGSSPLSLSPHGSMGGPPSIFGGLSHLTPSGCHMQVRK